MVEAGVLWAPFGWIWGVIRVIVEVIMWTWRAYCGADLRQEADVNVLKMLANERSRS